MPSPYLPATDTDFVEAIICSLCQREEVLEKVKIWHESETENYDMLWNVQCPVWHVQLRLFILPVSVYGDQDQPRLPRLPRPRAHLVRSEKFSRRWRRGGGWSCDCLSWHAAPPPADADIPWLGAVVIHTPDPGPCPCRDGVITISLHANPERLWHERLIILLLYLSQNLLDDRVGVNSKYWMVFPALCDYLLQTLF